MNVIERYSNWGYWDQLDGKSIVDGELLLVTWPDGGPKQIIRAFVVDRGVMIYDHGNSYMGNDVRATARIEYRGVLVEVPLIGLEAKRVTQ